MDFVLTRKSHTHTLSLSKIARCEISGFQQNRPFFHEIENGSWSESEQTRHHRLFLGYTSSRGERGFARSPHQAAVWLDVQWPMGKKHAAGMKTCEICGLTA
jgi:hypothetical protein